MYEKIGLLVVGVQIKGRIMIAPMDYVAQAHDVLFAIAPSDDQVSSVSAKGLDWEKSFKEAREGLYGGDDYAKKLSQAMLQRTITECCDYLSPNLSISDTVP